MKNYLLTGSTGFIGNSVTKKLLEKNVSLTVVIRRNSVYKLEQFPNIKKIILTENLFLENTEWWKKVCKDIDVVIHAAWYTQPENYLESSVNLECLMGSMNLACGASEAGIKRFLGVGTCFEYAPSKDPLAHDSAIGPFTLYGASKASLYLTLREWFASNSIPFAWARLFYVYGEGENQKKLRPTIQMLLEKNEKMEILNGDQIRDYIEVSEVGSMLADLSTSEQVGVVNICSGAPITIKDFSLKIADEMKKRHLLKFLNVKDLDPNTAAIVGVPNLKT